MKSFRIRREKLNTKTLLIALLVVTTVVIIPILYSSARYRDYNEIGSFDLSITADKLPPIDTTYNDSLTPFLAGNEIVSGGLSIKYLGNNVYVLNGRASNDNNTFIRLTNSLEMLSSADDSAKGQLLNASNDIAKVNDDYNFSVEVLGGTVEGASASNDVRVNFRSNEIAGGNELPNPQYDAVTGYIGPTSGKLSNSINAASLVISKGDTVFTNYVIKVNLNITPAPVPVYEKTLTGGGTLRKYSDGSYELDGTITASYYIRISTDDIVASTATTALYSKELVDNPLAKKGENITIIYRYISGTVDTSKQFAFAFRDTTTTCSALKTPKYVAYYQSTGNTPLDVYSAESVLTDVASSNVSSFSLFLSANSNYSNWRFFIEGINSSNMATTQLLDDEPEIVPEATTSPEEPVESNLSNTISNTTVGDTNTVVDNTTVDNTNTVGEPVVDNSQNENVESTDNVEDKTIEEPNTEGEQSPSEEIQPEVTEDNIDTTN